MKWDEKKDPPTLTAEQIVAVQPMTAPLPDGIKFVRREITPEMQATMDRHDKANAAVTEFFRSGQGDRWADETYTIVCPNCNGKLSFGGNSYNAHVHASCSTPNCCSWME